MKDDQRVTKSRSRRVLRHLPFARDLAAMSFAVRDRRTPLWVKGTLAAALAYFGLPFDVVPDVFLGLGFTDDAAAMMVAFRAIWTHVTDEHRSQAERWLRDQRSP